MNRRCFLGKGLTATAALTFGNSWAVDSYLNTRLLSSAVTPLKEGIIDKKLFAGGWKIRAMNPGDFSISGINNAGEWLVVPVVPAMPLDVLLHHKKIDQPWKPFGTEKCFWVSENDWVYLLDFSVENLSGEKRLVFKEMKGKVDVYLNGNKIASHADQSQPLVVDITGQLQPKNQLVLHFSKAAPVARADGKEISKRAEMGNYLGPYPMIYTSGIVSHVIL